MMVMSTTAAATVAHAPVLQWPRWSKFLSVHRFPKPPTLHGWKDVCWLTSAVRSRWTDELEERRRVIVGKEERTKREKGRREWGGGSNSGKGGWIRI